MSAQIFKFGVFELKPETGELWKHGVRVKLQTKPLQVLEALLAEPGEVVTREELFKRLWPNGTYVDFESGLNTATNRLRSALGDSADAPRYIETLPRLGYRFICPVAEKIPAVATITETAAAPAEQPEPQPAVKPPEPKKVGGRYQAAAAAVFLLVIILLLVFAHSKGSETRPQPAVRTEAGRGFGSHSSYSFTRSARAPNLN